jgi:hypothetical protein
MEGWISLHRKLKKHWIWKDPVKLKWWIDMLLSANHSDNIVNIGYELFECKRAQSIMSLQSWAEEWKTSKDSVRNFFKLLEKDSMITHENLGKTTRITICNYDSYQIELHEEQTQSKRKANAKQTQTHANNNDNNDNNIICLQKKFVNQINKLYPNKTDNEKKMLNEFYSYWSEPNKSKTKLKWQIQQTWDLQRRINKWFDNADKFKK